MKTSLFVGVGMCLISLYCSAMQYNTRKLKPTGLLSYRRPEEREKKYLFVIKDRTTSRLFKNIDFHSEAISCTQEDSGNFDAIYVQPHLVETLELSRIFEKIKKTDNTKIRLAYPSANRTAYITVTTQSLEAIRQIEKLKNHELYECWFSKFIEERQPGEIEEYFENFFDPTLDYEEAAISLVRQGVCISGTSCLCCCCALALLGIGYIVSI